MSVVSCVFEMYQCAFSSVPGDIGFILSSER